jgi:hypothetical protein
MCEFSIFKGLADNPSTPPFFGRPGWSLTLPKIEKFYLGDSLAFVTFGFAHEVWVLHGLLKSIVLLYD